MSKNDLKTKKIVNVTLAKDDILFVIIAEKEKELVAQIEKIEKLQDKLRDEKHQEFLKLQNFLLSKEEIGNLVQGTQLLQTSSVKRVGANIVKYDIQKLRDLYNPKVAVRKTFSAVAPGKQVFVHSINLQKNFKDSEGYTGTLYKRIELNPTSLAKTTLEKINKIRYDIFTLDCKISKLEYQLLLLETDKSIKGNFLKKIIEDSDFKKLL